MRHIALLVVSLVLGFPALAADRVLVPGGPFQMGCSMGDDQCFPDEGAKGGTRVDVPAFRIDRREVTVAEYRACVMAGKCERPKDTKLNKYCNYDHPKRDDHPVNCIDWAKAAAYCMAQGARLPREAEWEKAARAGSRTRYPWGQTVNCRNAIVDEVSPAKSSRGEPDGCYTDASWPVASRPANALGLFDMHGNIGEWTSTWYAKDAIADLYAKGNLDGPASGRQRVVRGGSWDEDRPNLRSSFRNVKPPFQGRAIYGSIGFRCVTGG